MSANDAYGYMMAIVWILFATIYYLSLLPRFNSEEVADRTYAQEAGHYPRFLEILVSYIAVPLVAAFTLVLLSYFVKIAVTRVWPTGHLGPMVLGYSSGRADYLYPGQPSGKPLCCAIPANFPQGAHPGGYHAACLGIYPSEGLWFHRVPLLRGSVWSLFHCHRWCSPLGR